MISDKRSERICGHYHENSWDKDRNFSQPIHTQVTPEKHLMWKNSKNLSIGEEDGSLKFAQQSTYDAI